MVKRRKRGIKKLLLNFRILVLILFLAGSIVSLMLQPLTFGIDISGGVALVVQTEHPVDAQTMQVIVQSLQRRLNTFGIKSISIEAQGNQIILIKIANITEQQAVAIKQLIESQGVFYMEFNGVIFGSGKDIVRVGYYQIKADNSWQVPFTVSKRAAEELAKLAKGKAGWPVDMFLDPPTNSILVVSPEVYKLMNSTEFNAQAPNAPTLLQRIEKALNITVVQYTNQTTPEQLFNVAEKMKVKNIVLAAVGKGLIDQLRKYGLKVRYVSKEPGESDFAFIKRVLGLYGPYALGEGLANGQPQTEVSINGGAQTRAQALEEAKVVYTVLSSGSLPVKLKVTSMEFISPKLGTNFKRQALYAGVGALVAVFLIVYLHYRRLRIAVPVTSTSLFEVIIILGIASLIKWNLDLPSIAGIIAAIGTGVDQQIVITDELLWGEGGEKIRSRGSLSRRISRAMFVIFASATTTIVAMSFLFEFFVGTLRGFAFTTILGTLIGILITRPAYAEIARYLLGEE